MSSLFLHKLARSRVYSHHFSQFSRSLTNEARKTCLYDFHVGEGGKMVDFAGYLLPVQYASQGITDSHKHTRSHCSIFDVSHMLQTYVHGSDRIKFAESLTVADVSGLDDDSGTLSLFTRHENGGIIDDLIVNKTSMNHLYLVTNAGCRDKDMPLMKNQEKSMKSDGFDIDLEFRDDLGLIAVQGPESSKVMQSLVKSVDFSKFGFMRSTMATIGGIENCRITRCGYTGEDGFELSVPQNEVPGLVARLLDSDQGSVKLAGLGARDSLRLEAGLCLYGNDIGENTTPVEAGLVWTIGKARRETANFPGADIILKQLKDKPSRKRVGLEIESKGPPARSHCQVFLPGSDQAVGEVTSGCPAPSLGKNIAMAYLAKDHAKIGTQLEVLVRKKKVTAQVVKMPFVKTNYFMI